MIYLLLEVTDLLAFQSFNHSTLALAKSRATLARPAGLGRPAGEACVRLPEATEEDLNAREKDAQTT